MLQNVNMNNTATTTDQPVSYVQFNFIIIYIVERMVNVTPEQKLLYFRFSVILIYGV